jgi:hypothetical protein
MSIFSILGIANLNLDDHDVDSVTHYHWFFSRAVSIFHCIIFKISKVNPLIRNKISIQRIRFVQIRGVFTRHYMVPVCCILLIRLILLIWWMRWQSYGASLFPKLKREREIWGVLSLLFRKNCNRRLEPKWCRPKQTLDSKTSWYEVHQSSPNDEG